MSDENTTRNDAATPMGTASGGTSEESTEMPPTRPIGSEAVQADASGSSTTSGRASTASTAPTTSTAATAAPAGPGEDVHPGDRDAVDSFGATSGSPVGKIAEAATDAAKQAGAKIREAAQSADLDEFADQAKRVTSDWTERIREEYRRRPGVVIGAAVGAVVLLGAIARGVGRRR
ncbi:hypothetical protein ACFQ58_03890 [Agromyces sp. NPDC056523]|uniref:hypothetical protein n=1 Tax=Agromyces sp. NPDC056523 TaxID=3345850 RepID=UPI00366EEE04